MKEGALGGHGEINEANFDSNLLILFSCKVGELARLDFYDSFKILRSAEDENNIDLLNGFKKIASSNANYDLIDSTFSSIEI